MYKVYATLTNGQKHLISKHASISAATRSMKALESIPCWASGEVLKVERGVCKCTVYQWTRSN